MGVFEFPAFAKGTTAIAAEMGRCTAAGATTIVGGGDSVAAVAQAGLQVRQALQTPSGKNKGKIKPPRGRSSRGG